MAGSETDPIHAESLLCQRWVEDEIVLSRIGGELSKSDTRLSVTLSAELAKQAVAAWQRDDDAVEYVGTETLEQARIRDHAAMLALIGCTIEERGCWYGDRVTVDVDAWFIGNALQAADQHGLVKPPALDYGDPLPRFINVSLNIQSPTPNSALASALEKAGTLMYNSVNDGVQTFCFELGFQPDTIEHAILAMDRIIRQLPTDAVQEWAKADSRIFNIGILAGREPNQPVNTLAPDLIKLVGAHNAGITFTRCSDHDRHSTFHQNCI